MPARHTASRSVSESASQPRIARQNRAFRCGMRTALPRLVQEEIDTKSRRPGAWKEWLRSFWPSYRDVTVGGARARYFCCGSGPPLLFLASPLALARSYRRATRTLCRSHTVVCVELPGSGGSQPLGEPWSVERYAEWALELVRYLPLAAPIVVGHGGSIAIAAELARRAPSEIGGLVLVEAGRSPTRLGLHAAPEALWNALRHRTTFVEHVKNACSTSLALARAGGPVPTIRATHLAGDWPSRIRYLTCAD